MRAKLNLCLKPCAAAKGSLTHGHWVHTFTHTHTHIHTGGPLQEVALRADVAPRVGADARKPHEHPPPVQQDHARLREAHRPEVRAAVTWFCGRCMNTAQTQPAPPTHIPQHTCTRCGLTVAGCTHANHTVPPSHTLTHPQERAPRAPGPLHAVQPLLRRQRRAHTHVHTFTHTPGTSAARSWTPTRSSTVSQTATARCCWTSSWTPRRRWRRSAPSMRPASTPTM